MTNFITRMAGVATLALAALPMAAIATVSQAAPVTATVQVADLDLNTEAGMTAFHRRAEVAAQEFCSVNGASRSLAAQSACLKGVRVEVGEKLTGLRQAQLAARSITVAAR